MELDNRLSPHGPPNHDPLETEPRAPYPRRPLHCPRPLIFRHDRVYHQNHRAQSPRRPVRLYLQHLRLRHLVHRRAIHRHHRRFDPHYPTPRPAPLATMEQANNASWLFTNHQPTHHSRKEDQTSNLRPDMEFSGEEATSRTAQHAYGEQCCAKRRAGAAIRAS